MYKYHRYIYIYNMFFGLPFGKMLSIRSSPSPKELMDKERFFDAREQSEKEFQAAAAGFLVKAKPFFLRVFVFL